MQACRKERKPRVAFIDNSINRDYIQSLLKKEQSIIDVLTVSNHQVMQDKRTVSDILSHATLCSKIFLEHVTCGCELFYLNIWDENETNANVNALLDALTWCLENGIQLINLSLGTTRLTDVPELLSIVNQLVTNNIIVVAASFNQRKLTFPAAFDQVIGIKAIPENRKQEKGFIYHENPIDRIQISCYVSDQALTYKGEYYYLGASNSLAAPTISAKVCDFLSQDYVSFDEIKMQLINQSVTKIPRKMYKMYKDYFQNKIDIPIIAVLNNRSNQLAKELDEYFLSHGYQGICLSESSETNFSDRIINIADLKCSSLMKKLQFYAHYCHADYLLVEINEASLFKQLDFKEIDLILHPSNFEVPKVKGELTCLSYSDYGDFTLLFDKIYRYLSV